MIRRLTILFVLACTPLATLMGQEPGPASTERSASFGPSANPVLSISLVWGRIDVVPHDRSDVRFVVTEDSPATDGLRSIAGPTGFQIEESDGRVSFAAVPPPDGVFRALNVTVFAPADVRLDLLMDRGGDISVESVGRELSITNRNGSVRIVDALGAAMVDARNGSIEASFLSLPDDAPLVLATLNGGVDVVLPADTKADLHLVTPGDIRTDFALDALPPVAGEEGEPRQVRAQLNGGGPSFYFQTHNGPITIRRGGVE